MPDFDVSRRELLGSVGAVGVGALTLGSRAARADNPDRHIIGATTPAATAAAKQRADAVHRVVDLGSYPTAVAGVFSDRALDELRRRSDVAYVEPDIQLEVHGQTLPWGIDRVDADVAWGDHGETGGDDGNTGDGGNAVADIAIVDTGIDDDHPDLVDNLGTGKAFQGSSWDDDNGHGTHVAGIADAVNNTEGVVGVSTEAILHAAKVCNGGGLCSASDIAAGLEWTADQGYDVANVSLGGSYSETIDNAGKYAYDNGVLLVSSAGNDGECSDCVSYPAANEEFIAVSATARDDSLASFSSTGCEVELAAPGDDIYSTYKDGDYATLSGTSMASPHVAGAGAQLMDNGDANADQSASDAESATCYPTSPGGAREQLQATAEDIGLGDNEQGAGLVDVEAALGLAALSVDSLSAQEVETSDGDAEFDVSWEVSDPEGDLDSLELVLEDTTDSETEDSATPSVSGDKASGTTRLAAAGDEGSGNSYEITATVTDGDGNTASASVSTAETEDTPTVDSLSLSEVETDNADAEFDVDWAVSDTDGDLDTLDLALTDDTDGETEDTASRSVSGDSASGTTRLVAAGDDGSGNEYTVEAVVADTDGTTTSDTATATESEDTSDGTAPTVDSLSLAEDNSGGSPHADFDASWQVSDDDGDLDTVDLTLTDLDDGETEDATSVSVSGSSASDTTDLKAKFEENNGHEYEVELVVTDSNGNTASATATEVEDGS